MKVLHVMSYSPEPPVFGGAIRIHYLLKHLVQNHDVTVVCFGEPDAQKRVKETFNSHLNQVHVVPYPWVGRYRRLGQLYSHGTNSSYLQLVCRSDEMQKTLDRILFENEFDLIQQEFCMMCSFDLQSDAIRILDAHNVEYDNYRRMKELAPNWLRRHHYSQECRKLYCEEISACRKQDAVFVTSARDKEILDADVTDVPKFIVPNGVDPLYFTPCENPSEPFSLVFTGMLGYVPNYDGMFYFLDEIFPLIRKEIPEVKIYIVGNRPPKELVNRATDNVVVTGFVEDVRPYVWRSSVYVVPLRMGSGTRLKVLEAMAMKKPIVTTSVGCEGIEVRHGETALIADHPVEFAQSVVELLRNKSLHHRLTENGYGLVCSRYDWSVINEYVEQIYQRLVRPAPVMGKEEKVYG